MRPATINRDTITLAAITLMLLLVVLTVAPLLTKGEAGAFGAIGGCAVIALNARLRAARRRN